MNVQSKKKGIKWVRRVAIICFVGIVLHEYNASAPINGFSWASYTKDQMIDMYRTHKNELIEVAEIVLANESMHNKIHEENDDDWGVYINTDKRHFTENDWESIVKLFKAVKPYMIMLSLRAGDDVVYLDFASRKEEDQEIDTSLYYIKKSETVERYKRYSFVGVLEHIEGYWYVGEHIYPD